MATAARKYKTGMPPLPPLFSLHDTSPGPRAPLQGDAIYITDVNSLTVRDSFIVKRGGRSLSPQTVYVFSIVGRGAGVPPAVSLAQFWMHSRLIPVHPCTLGPSGTSAGPKCSAVSSTWQTGATVARAGLDNSARTNGTPCPVTRAIRACSPRVA